MHGAGRARPPLRETKVNNEVTTSLQNEVSSAESPLRARMSGSKRGSLTAKSPQCWSPAGRRGRGAQQRRTRAVPLEVTGHTATPAAQRDAADAARSSSSALPLPGQPPQADCRTSALEQGCSVTSQSYGISRRLQTAERAGQQPITGKETTTALLEESGMSLCWRCCPL